jgi:hypothetical protein
MICNVISYRKSDIACTAERAQATYEKEPTVDEIYTVAEWLSLRLFVITLQATVLSSMSPSSDTKVSEGAADELAFNKVRTKNTLSKF